MYPLIQNQRPKSSSNYRLCRDKTGDPPLEYRRKRLWQSLHIIFGLDVRIASQETPTSCYQAPPAHAIFSCLLVGGDESGDDGRNFQKTKPAIPCGRRV